MTETRIGNTFSKFTAIHRAWRKLGGGICRYKTFCMRIFARRTFLRFRYCSIHVKIHVLLTYSPVKRRVSMGSRNLVPMVSPMSGSPTFDTEKKTPEKSSEANLYEVLYPPKLYKCDIIHYFSHYLDILTYWPLYFYYYAD